MGFVSPWRRPRLPPDRGRRFALGFRARSPPAQWRNHADECPICLLEVVAEYGKRECPCCRGALTTGKCTMPPHSARSGQFDDLSDYGDGGEPARGFTWHRFIFGWFFYCSITKSEYRDVDYLETLR